MNNELKFHKVTEKKYESECGSWTIMVSHTTGSWTVYYPVGPLRVKRGVDSLQDGIEFAQAKASAEVAA